MPAWNPNDSTSQAFLNQARRLEEPATWRRGLAERLAELCEAEHTVVGTCQLDRPGLYEASAWPPERQPFVTRVTRDFLPLFYDNPNVVAEVLRAHGPIGSIFKAFADHPVQAELIALHLAEGIGDYAATFVMTPHGVAGYVMVAAPLGADADRLLEARRERILWAASEIADALTLTLAMAHGLGVGQAMAGPSQAPVAGGGRGAGELRATFGLTARQQEIVDLVVDGLMDVNIAARLGIQESTVGTHLHTIYRRLGVHSRAQLIGRVAAWFERP